jgi:uncharacterized protein YmfQ (DUF2313 family)
MPPSDESIALYRDIALKHVPPGRLATGAGSNMASALEALVVEFATVHEEAATLLDNRTPSRAVDYLDDWEAALGLPDACGVLPSDTDEERQAGLVDKLTRATDMSRAAYDELATALGVTIESVTHYAPFTAGASAGSPLYGPGWAYLTRIRITADGGIASDDVIATLLCVIGQRLKRAHTHVDVYSALEDD